MFAALILIVPLALRWHGSERREPRAQQVQAAAFIGVFENQQAAATQESVSKGQTQQRPAIPPWWDAAWATWALVVVGTAGTIAALCTLATIRRQTESLITSERAWVMVDVDWIPGMGRGFVGRTVAGRSTTENMTVIVRLTYKNEGRSPAWIAEKRANVKALHSLPAKPDLDSAEVIQREPEPLAIGRELKKDITLTCNERDADDTAVVYGVVRYRDAFGENRETTFGYVVRLGQGTFERLAGYPEYNKYT